MKDLTENDVNWVITKPFTTAYIGDGQTVPKKILLTRKNIKKGDRVALIYHNGCPIYTEKVTGSTLKSIFLAIERGMKKVIEVNHRNTLFVYSTLGRFLHKNMRLKLTNKYEKGMLTPADLAGDYIFYEGHMQRDKGIWIYGLGS